MNSRPRLATGCRLNDNGRAQRELVMPGRTLRVSGPSLEMITRCDGKHTVREIVAALQKLYSKADAQKVQQDMLEYLERLRDEGAIEFTPGSVDRSGGAR
ncbi:MAG: PqqD family peptide modification chaperone [Candidatus Acidiferrales bacterium]